MILERLHSERINDENNLCTTISNSNALCGMVVLETT
jgi:hypothetical protein